MLEDGILKIFHSDTDLIESEEEFRKEFADILPFEQFQDILKTDSYIPDAEDYESLIRFVIKENPIFLCRNSVSRNSETHLASA